ncbi:uncharacterized protein si:ch211-171b20.3 isoform X1 [Xiphias gladius]|uniref:uncharacterized protein si:ch211-171b20.3 isoform X1 n=1 Tax=Xiphias gladius TaxID=8245 RepID=UPI001A982F88|nr:uncharacterized protein si:ch211-171b20.3 isoform X1 [Xiphias gladius]
MASWNQRTTTQRRTSLGERTRTVIPPLPRDYHVHRPGKLHPFSLSKELSHSHAGQPFTLGPKVNYPTNNLLTVKDNQKSQSYPDPVVGASRSFIHRVSELSSLEGETVTQEKLKKTRKPRKPPS